MGITYLWDGVDLDGDIKSGVIESDSRKSASRSLRAQGVFKISLTAASGRKLNSPLSSREIIEIVSSLRLMLSSGVSISNALDLQSNEKKSLISRYVWHRLKAALHQGKSLEKGFRALDPLFSEFFVSMVGLCEKTGKLLEGLQFLENFYQKQEARSRELKKITRYPKIVFLITFLITLGVIIFIVPMFKNIYSLFDGDLPLLTQTMIFISDFIREHAPTLAVLTLSLFVWSKIPLISRAHPLALLLRPLKNRVRLLEDQLIYAHAMKVLLENGQPVSLATRQAADCLSSGNQKHALKLSAALNAGLSFSEAFQREPWFSKNFQRFISSAEKAGLLVVGFEQVYNYFNWRRENGFNKWSKFVEPLFMLMLGCFVMSILLAVYLPIFDLGNRIG